MSRLEQTPTNSIQIPEGSGDYTLPAINEVARTMDTGEASYAVQTQAPEAYGPTHEAWGNVLDTLSASIPEVAEDRNAIEQGGRTLIDGLEIDSSLFEGVPHTIMFAALGQRKARLEAGRDILDADAYEAENTFIRNAAMLLALQRSGKFEVAKDSIYNFNVYDEAAVEKAYDRFTNVQLTAELQQAIDNGLLDDVKSRLGITDNNEDPYVLHVLNIGDSRSMAGMRPRAIIGDSESAEVRGWKEANAAFEEYSQGLDRNNKTFMEATGTPAIPLAWMVPLQGRRHLNVSLPTAEKLLHPEDVRLGYRKSDDGEEERAILEHEYVHTQGGHTLDQHIFYGIGLEERRAELFAGNKMGYEDIKGLIDFDFTALTGISLTSSVREAVKGGSAEKLYTQLAQRVGLQTTLEVALTTPERYITDAYPMQRDVQEYLGGINGLEARIYDRMDADDRAYFDRILDAWATNNASRDIEHWLIMRERQFGLGFVTQKLRKALDAKREELGITK